jgi:hypothetical protein
MKFFDYKFLILLGLTLVIYLIYREVDYLRNKVSKIENELNQKKLIEENKTLQIKNNPNLQPIVESKQFLQPIVESKQFLQPIVESNVIHAKSPEKIINIDLVSQTIDKLKDETSSYEEEQNISTTTDLESESSKHLAIYSNDNEQFDSAQNSLIDSVEATKFNVENPDLKTTMNNIINDLTSESEKSNKSKQEAIEEIIMEKEKQLSEMSPKSDKKNKITEAELNEKKLGDIKDMAIKLGITVTKKINGQQRVKTKQDLISEILLK